VEIEYMLRYEMTKNEISKMKKRIANLGFNFKKN
jgi:hypothetical protein